LILTDSEAMYSRWGLDLETAAPLWTKNPHTLSERLCSPRRLVGPDWLHRLYGVGPKRPAGHILFHRPDMREAWSSRLQLESASDRMVSVLVTKIGCSRAIIWR